MVSQVLLAAEIDSAVTLVDGGGVSRQVDGQRRFLLEQLAAVAQIRLARRVLDVSRELARAALEDLLAVVAENL